MNFIKVFYYVVGKPMQGKKNIRANYRVGMANRRKKCVQSGFCHYIINQNKNISSPIQPLTSHIV